MIGNFFSFNCLGAALKSQILTRDKWATSVGHGDGRRSLPQSLRNQSGELASILSSAESRWEFVLLPLSFGDLWATYTAHICVFCIWTKQRLPNSWTLAGPRRQESGPAPSPPGRGSREGWKEPPLYRLILLWISCLPCLPNLILNSPASPSVSQVSWGKKPDFISGCNRWAFW